MIIASEPCSGIILRCPLYLLSFTWRSALKSNIFLWALAWLAGKEKGIFWNSTIGRVYKIATSPFATFKASYAVSDAFPPSQPGPAQIPPLRRAVHFARPKVLLLPIPIHPLDPSSYHRRPFSFQQRC